jgi:sigma-B regulation protein RsbU (phosphoserine phosphatase)
MPASIQRVFVGVLFVLIAALQIRETVTAVQVLSHSAAFAAIPAIKPTTLEYYEPGTASRAAGVKRGDVLVAVDGVTIHSRAQEARIFSRHTPGDALTLTLRRGKSPPFDTRYVVTASSFDSSAILSVIVLNVVTPWSCILLGFLVAFRRPGDPVTWPLLCLLICVSQSFRGYSIPPDTWNLAFSWPALFFGDFAVSGMAVAWMWFAIQFPDPKSPNRVWPWTRYAVGLPFVAFEALGSIWFATSVHDPKALAWLSPITRFPDWADRTWGVTLILIGCLNLASKLRREANPSMRRRLRWLVLGLVGGMCPLVGLAVVAGALGRDFNSFPLPILLTCMMSPFLIPLTLAYALLVDRLLDVGVFVRQGLLASKTVSVIRVVFMTALIYFTVSVASQPGRTGPARVAELVACAAGIVLTRRGANWLRKWVDRHFFQEAVSSEHLLIELSGAVRGIREPETLLRTVTDRIASAMHVTRVAALMPNSVSFVPAYAFGGVGSEAVPFDDPAVTQLRESRRPLSRADELLVPISTGGELHGILSLGPKRSEEPYSGRDVALLESVAGQTAVALENTRLTAAVAKEAAHRERITSELEIARTVQDRLFPKSAPRVPGLDLAGFCRPAQTVAAITTISSPRLRARWAWRSAISRARACLRRC